MKKSLSFLRLMFIALFALMGMSVWADEVTDKLDQSVTGVTGTTYTEFSGKSVTSDAVYAGQCAGGNESIQLRSNNNNSGVITTASGGNVRKIAVVWNENTAEARTLQVYGSNTAYAAATDLYDASKQGDLLGEIPMGTRELEIEGDYAFIGFKSKSGAMYLTSVSITWETASAGPTVEKPVITPATGTYFEAQTVTITAEEGAEIYYTLNGGEEQKYEAPFSVTETTEIEAYAKKGTDVSKTTKVTVTFGPIYNTFAAANEAATSDRIVSRVNFTDALVTYVNGSNAYIKDASGALMIYGTNNLVAGDKIKGYVQGQLYTYNGLPEIASPNFNVETVSSENMVTPVEISAADLAANPLKYVSQYVKVKPARFEEDAEVASKVNLNFTVGNVALVLRNNFVLEFGVEASKAYEVAGMATIYNGTVQLYPTKEEDIAEVSGEELAYYDALAAIEDGKDYNIFTEVDGQKYYVTVDGKLSNAADDGGIFTFKKVTGGAYKQYGWKIDSGSKRFTNPPLSNNVANLKPGAFATTTGDRNDWEAQVLFLADGKYAIRSCNTAHGTSSWADAGRTYWTWAVNEAVTPEYTYDQVYQWEIEGPLATVKVTYALYDVDGTEPISTATKKQKANSEVEVPGDMTSGFAYNYTVEGTVGEGDCTIKVVRTFKEGVVHSLADLSNNKAYTIRCDRGALLTKDDHVASTAHGSLSGAEAGLFAIINHEDHYYLYSVADKKFMTFDPTLSPDGARGPLADAPTHGTEDAIVLEAKTDPYFFAYFTAGGTNYGFNTNGNDPYGYVINTWMTADQGNQYYMIEAADFDPTEALVALGVQPKLEYTKYIVQNVGSGLYWGAGNDWGTRASLIANPEFVKLDPTDMPEGQYKLESQVNNGGTQYYFNGDYMDNGSPAPLAITMLANGNFTIANATDGGFYGYDGNSTILGKGLTNADDPNAQWTIVTLEEAKAALANATEEAPMNAGMLFDDLNFGRNNRYSNKWIVSEDCTNKNLSGGNNTNNNAESFHSVFTVSQSVEAPNGVYEITAQGFYRQDGSDNENLPVFFANEETQTFPLKTGSENSMSDASVSFTNGLYTIDPIYVQVTDGTLNIGAKLEGNTNLWCIWDNFQVKYYGADANLIDVKFAAMVAQVEELRAKAEALKGAENVSEAANAGLETVLAATADVAKEEEALKTAIASLTEAIDLAEAGIEIVPKLEAAKTLAASTNVVTAEAKAAYEAYIADAETKYNEGTLTKTEAIAFENPLVVTGWQHDASKVADDLLLSAWTINDVQAKDFTTSLYINTWSVEGENDGSNFKVPFFEYWTGDGNSLGTATISATMTDIEAGWYEVSVLARVRAKDGYTAPAYGITLDVNGGEAVDVAAGKQVGNTQFYLAEFKTLGEVGEDGILKINLNVAEDNNISWLSFKNVNYTTSDDPSPDAAYERALAAIEDGQNYRIFTEVDGQKYYVTEAGKLSSATADGGIFALKKVTGGAFKEYGWKIDSGSKRFTNPPLTGDNVANLTPGAFATTTGDRNDWEAQVLFLTNGKYAIRSCNTAHATSSWGDAGRTFWTWTVNEAVVPEYTYDQVYLWQFEGPLTTVNVTYALYDAEGTEAISTATKKQEANSEVIIPADMASNFAYDYTTEGTVGEEDCTIKVVRTFKEGVVHSLDDLSNEKAYTIRCDRGALLTKDDHVASTAHGSLNGAEAGQFAIINYEDHYYLYSIADKKFMTFDPTASPEGARGPLADEPTHGTEDAIILEAKTDPYFLAYFTAGGANYGFNTNGNDPYGYVINSWMNADQGNQYYMVEAADFDPTEALAALEAFFHPAALELAIDVERYTGLGYGATTFEPDFTEALEFLGIENVTDATLTFINPDDSEVEATFGGGTPDGWCDENGALVGWGETSKICVKFNTTDSDYSIFDMNGADVLGTTYTVRYALTANGKKVVYSINVTFVEAPVKYLENYTEKGSIDVNLYPTTYGEAYNAVLSDEYQESVVSELIGAEWENIYGVGAKVDGKATLTDIYSCDPAPGFWCLADGTADQWANSAFGVSLIFSEDYSTFHFSAWTKEAVTGSLRTTFYLVNEATKEYVAYNIILNDTPVGINAIDADQENAVIYDLNGRRVSKAVKGGVYIINGKKVFIKK